MVLNSVSYIHLEVRSRGYPDGLDVSSNRLAWSGWLWVYQNSSWLLLLPAPRTDPNDSFCCGSFIHCILSAQVYSHRTGRKEIPEAVHGVYWFWVISLRKFAQYKIWNHPRSPQQAQDNMLTGICDRQVFWEPRMIILMWRRYKPNNQASVRSGFRVFSYCLGRLVNSSGEDLLHSTIFSSIWAAG